MKSAKRGLALALVFSMTAPEVAAQQLELPKPDDTALENMLPPGHGLESRADGDLNADGLVDVAFVGGANGARALYCPWLFGEVDFGHVVGAKGPLEAYPITAATLSVARGVVVVQDLTGGTVAPRPEGRFGRRRLRQRAAAPRERGGKPYIPRKLA